jgi:hypothetical protein
MLKVNERKPGPEERKVVEKLLSGSVELSATATGYSKRGIGKCG